MTAAIGAPTHPSLKIARLSARAQFVAAFLLIAGLQLELVFNRPINWDEYYHLSETHAFVSGSLTEALQTLYARLFFFVALLPTDLENQIRVARLFMFGCELFTTYAIFRIASRFAKPSAAALAAMAYLTGGFVFQHGFSFRADPLAAALLMGALWILALRPLDRRQIAGFSILVGLALLSTIKVVLFAPAFAGVAWLRFSQSEDRVLTMKRIAACFAGGALCAALLIWLTIATLPQDTDSARAMLAASTKMATKEGWFPRFPYFLLAVAMAPLAFAAVFGAPYEIFRSQLAREEKIALLGLVLPIVCLAFYRNAFPYFYAFILPPVMIGAAVALAALPSRYPPRLLAIAFTVNALCVSLATPREVLPVQKMVDSAVHRMFPKPVSYFDFPGMIADFPKANFFMTTWGYTIYQAGGFPSLAETAAKKTVPLLIVNQGELAASIEGPTEESLFSPQDTALLRDGFVPHWGPIWVAGHQFAAAPNEQTFRIYAPGTYTLERSTAIIDGQSYEPGALVDLTRGEHRVVTTGPALLRWGNHLWRPMTAFPDTPVFKDF